MPAGHLLPASDRAPDTPAPPTPETTMPLIELRRVTKTFPGRDRGSAPLTALDAVDLTINEGEIFGIIGYSGAGKSTLVRLINALEKPSSGNVIVAGCDLTQLPERTLREVRLGIG